MSTRIFHTAVLVFRCAAIAVGLGLILSAPTAQAAVPENLASYRGKNRVLLVFAPASGDPRYKKQQDLLTGNAGALKERDLVRIDVLEKTGSSLRRRYSIESGDFRMILVGKDGHTAYSTNRPVAAADLFRRIDRMPMRRDEMRQRRR